MTSPLITAALLGLLSTAVLAEPQAVTVNQAWARATVPGQKASGAFMTLRSAEGARLLGVGSPQAGVAEIHEMRMDGDIMKMKPVAALDLPAGQAVELKPGGYHLMLMDLKAPLNPGASLPLTLDLQDAKGQKFQIELRVPVAQRAPDGPAPAPQHPHGHHSH